MTALQELDAYLRRLGNRLRLSAASRGFAIVAPSALAVTVLLVWISNRYQFAHNIVVPLRILLFLVVLSALWFGMIVPLARLRRRRVTKLAEDRIPDFEERLLTLTERRDAANPFTELLAEDALRVARVYGPEQVGPARNVVSFFVTGSLAAGLLVWLIAAGPGYWGYGASVLWTGAGGGGKRPLYDVGVQPGNKTIRRRTDQLITAQTFGFSARNVSLYVKHHDALKWEQASMQPKPDGNGYQFLFPRLPDGVEYYVQADAAQSKHFAINVKDLPAVQRVRVRLHFPPGLGLQDVVDDPGGDVRAVEGTEAEISILTDRPLNHGALVLDHGGNLDLSRGEGNWVVARLRVQKDGAYHIVAFDDGEAVRISDDYFIESKKDEPPSVKILKPGHDPRVSPIEEVPVTVEAADDFGVNDLQLHYSVNGGPEQSVPLAAGKAVKEAQGKTTLYLENFKVVPGDVVSMYATAHDARTTAHSDIIFAQAEPFDFKFSQSQQAGGGMGGMDGGNQENISERQKQIIAATFNEVRGSDSSRASTAEHARFLSDLQAKLGAQAKTLADRMASRELGSANSQFEEFSKFMTQASSEMDTAVTELKPAKWHEALAPEQRALQSLLRAEALFRDIQVAFGQKGGGGGGGGAQRDLARMFDLELDTSKNQYETGQSASAASEKDQQKAIDEAFERLQMLARRQQELADQQAQQQAFEQRWQEEQLRREAEELRQQIQQLAQNSQGQEQSASSEQRGQQGGGSSSSSSQQSSESGQRSRQAGGGGSDRQNQQMSQALRQTMNALQKAEEQMRQAVSGHDATAQQRAAAHLREAQETLNRSLNQQAGTSVADLARRAQEIASAQKGLADQMKRMYGEQGSSSNAARQGRMSSESASGEDGMPEMNDPNSVRFGYGFRRRNWQQEMEPRRLATEQERALASDKEKLSQQLSELQRSMQQQVQMLAGAQPGVSSKLRKALSEAEQKELALRMQKDAEWMRQGYGDRNLGMENGITAGVQDLSRQLRDAERAVESGDQSGQGGGSQKATEELSRVRALREELERASDAGGQQSGSSFTGPRGGEGVATGRQDLQSAVRELENLRAHVDPRDRELSGYLNGAIGTLQHLTGAEAGLLDARLSREAMVSLERLEVELNKRASEERKDGTRTGAPEASPEKYRDSVAQYFKKLSK